MNPEQLLNAADALAWISVRLKELPEAREDALSAALHCTIANMVVVELAKHISEGVEPYDALRLAAIGSLPARPKKDETIRYLANMASRPKAPDSLP